MGITQSLFLFCTLKKMFFFFFVVFNKLNYFKIYYKINAQ